jgi:SAM-dependent methyltransferase
MVGVRDIDKGTGQAQRLRHGRSLSRTCDSPTVSKSYDEIGRTYVTTRRADPRIACRIHAAIGDVAAVANVGAGAGSYEPAATVVAVEPSQVMIAQRSAGCAPVVRASAERLPLRSGSLDAAMASLTIHHWTDLEAGVAEMTRVARHRVVFFTWREDAIADFWLLADYFPEAAAIDRRHAVPVATLTSLLPGDVTVETVPIPHDCTDGFGAAYWRRPQAYLDPQVRAGMSFFARLEAGAVDAGVARLAAEIASGAWQDKYGDLLELDEVDVGYCLVSASL